MSNAAEAHLQVTLAEIEDATYRLIAAGFLRSQLSAARLGVLDVDWRTALIESTAEPLAGLSDSHLEMRLKAADEIANIANQDWEPQMKVGWRDSLEAWHAATKRCIDHTLAAQVSLRRSAGLSSADAEAAAAMDRDLSTASYRAGLTAAGLVSDWPRWLIERVHTAWPAGARKQNQLDAMEDPAWRRQLQQLPRYWA